MRKLIIGLVVIATLCLTLAPALASSGIQVAKVSWTSSPTLAPVQVAKVSWTAPTPITPNKVSWT